MWGSGYRQEVVIEVGCGHPGSPTRSNGVTFQACRLWWACHQVLGTEPDTVQRLISIDWVYIRLRIADDIPVTLAVWQTSTKPTRLKWPFFRLTYSVGQAFRRASLLPDGWGFSWANLKVRGNSLMGSRNPWRYLYLHVLWWCWLFSGTSAELPGRTLTCGIIMGSLCRDWVSHENKTEMDGIFIIESQSHIASRTLGSRGGNICSNPPVKGVLKWCCKKAAGWKICYLHLWGL